MPRCLPAEKVRWFYQEPGKFWQPFSGPDSLAIEYCYTRMTSGGPSEKGAGLVQVMGDLYEVNIKERTCNHIYWTCEYMFVVIYITGLFREEYYFCVFIYGGFTIRQHKSRI